MMTKQASKKILVIISTSDPNKARAGMMYALNAKLQKWMEDVQLFFFGPSEQLVLEDQELQGLLQEFQQDGQQAVACRFIAEEEDSGRKLTEQGIEVDFVGSRISELIHQGYVPMIW